MKAFGPNDTHSDVAANKIKLGLFLIEHGQRYQEAEQLCREALASIITNNPNLKRLVARAHWGIGRAIQQQGRTTEAKQELRKAVAQFSQLQPFNAQSIADAEISLAENLLAQRRVRDAETLLLYTQNILKNASADSSDEMVKVTQLLWGQHTRPSNTARKKMTQKSPLNVRQDGIQD